MIKCVECRFFWDPVECYRRARDRKGNKEVQVTGCNRGERSDPVIAMGL